MVLKKRDISSALESKGFQRTERDHIFFIYFTKEGKKTRAYTKMSRGAGTDIDLGLVNRMAKQCKVTKQDFADLVKCPLSRDRYEKKLNDQGVI